MDALCERSMGGAIHYFTQSLLASHPKDSQTLYLILNAKLDILLHNMESMLVDELATEY